MGINDRYQHDVLNTERADVPQTFRPFRPVAPILPVPVKVATKPKPAPILVNPSGSNGVPKVLLSLAVVQTPVAQQTYTNCNVTVSFTRDFSDTNFDHVNIWFVGYHGSSTPTLMASGVSAPVNFLVDATHETVTVYVQTVSASGLSAAYNYALSTSVTLSGVVGAAPAPTISQTLIATPLGYQFAFNQVVLPAGDIDVVTAYRVYRNTSANTFAGSVLNQTLVHDPTHLGAIVVQDNVGANKNYYYFVTSVNSAGLESSSVSAQSGAVTSAQVSTFNSNAVNASGLTTTTGAILSQSGATFTINVASFTIQYGDGQVSYNSGSVNPGATGTFGIYFDDPTYAGGAVTYQFAASGYTVVAAPGRVFIGTITTVVGGGGTGGHGGGNVCFLPNVRVAGGRKISELEEGDWVVTKRGQREVRHVLIRDYEGFIYHMGNDEWVTETHHFVVGNVEKMAHELWAEKKWYAGKVWNLTIDTEDEEERNFFLENGMLSHNLQPSPC